MATGLRLRGLLLRASIALLRTSASALLRMTQSEAPRRAAGAGRRSLVLQRRLTILRRSRAPARARDVELALTFSMKFARSASPQALIRPAGGTSASTIAACANSDGQVQLNFFAAAMETRTHQNGSETATSTPQEEGRTHADPSLRHRPSRGVRRPHCPRAGAVLTVSAALKALPASALSAALASAREVARTSGSRCPSSRRAPVVETWHELQRAPAAVSRTLAAGSTDYLLARTRR